ncbi:3314_t:CDS:2 [Paraglomus occultum]|uniref:Vacuolar protein-sorting-associated protein 36 n=1 Tax=Paraglomus occultum TaxID=144539 RepID=A0A9N8WD77_9GLOM|nr:3314_t:CDS:2 [Paraglomus occultum]
MDRFARIDLTSSLQPILGDSETLLIIQDNVGLYDGDEKAPDYTNGKAYLTTHRIIYVDSTKPQTHSVSLDLKLVKAREHFTGFLKSSPKIILRFTDSNSTFLGPPPSVPTTNTASPSSSLQQPQTWICFSCSYSNFASTLKCELCGVKRPDALTSSSSTSLSQTQISPTPVLGEHFPNASLGEVSTSPTLQPVLTSEGISCPRCTFSNHPSMVWCELCGMELGTFRLDGMELSDDGSVEKTGKEKEWAQHVKLAFRNGGNTSFYEKLKLAMTKKEWEKTTESISGNPQIDFDPVRGGIIGIMKNVAQNQEEQKETLAQGFKDIDALMAKASVMVKLAESIKMKLNKDSSESEVSADDDTTFSTYLLELGMSNPVTKKDSGSIYHQELARQLAEFLSGLLHKNKGMMVLTDVYCLFNRARGVALISPDDLYKACSLFEPLDLPMRLHQLASGLLVVQAADHNDDVIAKKILEYIRQRGSLTAIELAAVENTSITLVNEQLQMTVSKGLICTDETVEGVRFYENIIINYQWDPETL